MIYNKAELQALMNRLAPGAAWKPYVLQPDPVVMDNGASKEKNWTVTMVDGRAFIWAAALAKCDNAAVMAGTDTIWGGVDIKFDEAGGFGSVGKTWFMLESLFSWGTQGAPPRELPCYVSLEKKDTLAGSLLNRTGGNLTVELCFIGVKAY